MFKTTVKAWLTQAVLPILFWASASVVLICLRPYLRAVLISLGVFGLILFRVAKGGVMPMWRTSMEASDNMLSGRIAGCEFKIRWNDVLSAEKISVAKQPLIQLTAKDEVLTIPLKFIDGEALWETVKLHVNAKAIEEGAFRKTPEFQNWSAESATFVAGIRAPLKVTVRTVAVIGWLCTLLFLPCSIAACVGGMWGAAVVFLIFAAMGVYLILNSGTIEMTAECVSYSTPLGRYEVKWGEVKYIETDIQRQGIVLYGEGKRLAIYGPGYWSGDDTTEMAMLLTAQLEQFQIETKETQKALWARSKNTKIRRATSS
jgi:hypothetical protein